MTAGSVWADDKVVAHLVGLKGNVLISQDRIIVSASEGAPLVPGSRVLVTINSEAVVAYANGCRLHFGPDEHFEVSRDSPCTDLIEVRVKPDAQRGEP